MIYRYFISIILLIISITLIFNNFDYSDYDLDIPNYVVSDLPEIIIRDNIEMDELNDILSKIKSEKGILIEEFKLVSNFNFDDNKTYSIYIKRHIPQNIVRMENYEKLNYNVFDFLEVDLDKVWKNSEYAIQTDLFKFSGIIMKNNNKKAYVYFKNELIELNEKMKLGNYRVLRIYSNGVLLYNEYMNRFEVLR
ncbi:hypothetical protein [Marinitoga litoralis]|jgi:uncharacterized ubiquitin-like protein YukD|uniref:hypothetical protein n=1 Tax=Marinitoga litoralis TaxID=570855 RepID=UPI001960B489|nr:hypothetical protein [Marinitoga litoralis]MBM7558639.1 putative ubiquitin-like protein YukD [Marinitoga litoralis]